MKVQKQSLNVQIDPLSFTAGIQILSGNSLQSYNKDTDEYEEDRALVPLIIMPWASVVDPHGIMNKGFATLTSIAYYLGSPSSGTQIIADGDNYAISDTGTPANSLKIKKNTPVNSPEEIYAVFNFTDTRTNQSVTVERSIPLRTTYYDSRNYSVKIDQPKGFTIDPTRTSKAGDGSWPVVLNAQMYSGKEEVADSNAAYFWYVLENGAFRMIDSNNEDIWMRTDKNANGTYPKQITVDARLFSNLTIRAMSAYYADGASIPTSPDSQSVQATTTINVQLPQTAYAKMVITKGSTILPSVNQPVEARCVISDNVGIINTPTDYYFIKWKKTPQTTGASSTEIGYGETLLTTSAEMGITNALGCNLDAEVSELGPYKVLVDSDGKALVDSDGKVLISQ